MSHDSSSLGSTLVHGMRRYLDLDGPSSYPAGISTLQEIFSIAEDALKGKPVSDVHLVRSLEVSLLIAQSGHDSIATVIFPMSSTTAADQSSK